MIRLVLSLLSCTLIAAPSQIPNTQMIDQDGKAFRTHDFKGQHLLLSFVFTSCPMPKMCPLTMQLNRKTAALWKKEIGTPLRLLVITLDPQADTPAVLKKYGQTHGLDLKSTTLATGVPQALVDFESAFNVAGWPSGNTTVHNLKTILVGPDLVEIKQYLENEFKPEDVVRDAKASLSKKS